MTMMKKISAMAMATAVVATMAVGTAISASAASVTDANNSIVGDCSFYRFKNDEWSVAPYGMDDGNIAKAELTEDGNIKLYFDYAEYKVMGFLPVTGGIADVDGVGVIEKGEDANNDYCLDWAIIEPDTEFSLTICTEDGNTNIAFGMMPNPITAKLVYTAE